MEDLLSRARLMQAALEDGSCLDSLRGRVMASLFFQPSTRTRLSFESAMLRLGGKVIGFADREQSRSGLHSVGESLADTARAVESYADVIVVRHPEIGAAREIASHSRSPVVNAGDGQGEGAEHPTQAILDLYAISSVSGRLDGVRVAVVGGLHQRVCHSLLTALSLFDDVEVKLVSPPEDRLSEAEQRSLSDAGLALEAVDAVDDVLSSVEVIYHAGLSEDPRQPVPDAYRLTAKKLRRVANDVVILHPLPRHGEITPDVDALPCAGYFDQAAAGVPLRMAVLDSVIDSGGGRAQ